MVQVFGLERSFGGFGNLSYRAAYVRVGVTHTREFSEYWFELRIISVWSKEVHSFRFLGLLEGTGSLGSGELNSRKGKSFLRLASWVRFCFHLLVQLRKFRRIGRKCVIDTSSGNNHQPFFYMTKNIHRYLNVCRMPSSFFMCLEKVEFKLSPESGRPYKEWRSLRRVPDGSVVQLNSGAGKITQPKYTGGSILECERVCVRTCVCVCMC